MTGNDDIKADTLHFEFGCVNLKPQCCYNHASTTNTIKSKAREQCRKKMLLKLELGNSAEDNGLLSGRTSYISNPNHLSGHRENDRCKIHSFCANKVHARAVAVFLTLWLYNFTLKHICDV